MKAGAAGTKKTGTKKAAGTKKSAGTKKAATTNAATTKKSASTKKAATTNAATTKKSAGTKKAAGKATAARASGLATYRDKRDPDRTPEPMGTAARARSKRAGPAFVVQEHHATALHWDFRLERDGVLVSWAIPKGVPVDPGQNRLAVHTEDHPLEYGTFEGEIPRGEYGGGMVELWDQGYFECEKWTEREVIVRLHGSRVSGRYVLFKTGGRNWMIHRMDPAPAGWEPMPEEIRPMLATLGQLPATDRGWAYEFKWDGIRAVTYIEGGRVRILTRNGNDVTEVYPELRGLGQQLGATAAVLDGEIVAMDEDGHPSFARLQKRMQVRGAAQVRRAAAGTPVDYLIFDLLYLDGRTLTGETYDERRSALGSLALDGPGWVVTDAFVDATGEKVLDVARDGGLEGVVAKLRNSRYQAGRRSDSWVKVKLTRTQEVVVGGWTPGKGSRGQTFGALLVGVPGPDGRLDYVGRVGTGFSVDDQAELLDRLRPLADQHSPFGAVPSGHRAGATWVRPSLVGEARFTEWTKDGQLRHPVWRGLRPDKSADEVVRE